jgi:hypothetical protein
MNNSSLCVGANIHLDDILLRAVDKLSGHEVIEPFHATHNLPGRSSLRRPLLRSPRNGATLALRSAAKRRGCCGSLSIAC